MENLFSLTPSDADTNGIKSRLADLYLDWCNNFLTYERFASYYGLEVTEAKQMINLGRTYQEERAGK